MKTNETDEEQQTVDAQQVCAELSGRAAEEGGLVSAHMSLLLAAVHKVDREYVIPESLIVIDDAVRHMHNDPPNLSSV